MGHKKRNVNTYPNKKTFDLQSFLQNILGQWWHKVCESNQAISDLTHSSFRDIEHIPATACVYKKQEI